MTALARRAYGGLETPPAPWDTRPVTLFASISLGASRLKPAGRRSVKRAEALYLEGRHVIVESINALAGRV